MVIGPRVWKTGLAVAVTLLIADYFNLSFPYLAAIAAIISLQPTISDSFKKGWERILATAVGAVVSISMMFTLGSNPLLVGFAIIITILICLKFGLTEAITLASVTVAIVMAGERIDAFYYALHRSTILPFLGIIVAVSINWLFSPPQHLNLLKKSLRNLSESTEMLMMRVINCFLTCENYSPEHIDQLANKIYALHDEAKQNLNMYKNEQGYKKYFYNRNKTSENKEIETMEKGLELLWLISQRVLDIQYVTEQRCERMSKIENPSAQYNDLLHCVQELLFLTVSFQRNVLENFLEFDTYRRDLITSQASEITALREDLQKRINRWQESHLGPEHIRSLVEIATLVYDLDQICNLLFKLNNSSEKTEQNENNLS